MARRLDGDRFGPWALVTGASSGIGRECASQIAASRMNIVLVARRQDLLEAFGAELSGKFKVQHRVVATDLSEEGFITGLADATSDLDIGLIVSNAGGANPGRFTDKDPAELARTLRLSALAHAELALHFGRKLIKRGRGGLLFVGAMGARPARHLWRTTAAPRLTSKASAWRSMRNSSRAESLCDRGRARSDGYIGARRVRI